jgi:twitching motility protein PilT
MSGMGLMSQLLRVQAEKNASDLHITVGCPPQLRLDGELVPIKLPPLSQADTASLCMSILTQEQKELFERRREIDLSYSLKGVARFRVNLFLQKGGISAAFRLIPSKIRPFDSLSLPPAVAGLCDRNNGLVLVTGATGSGKSTTLAAMIDKINERDSLHILTLEDPIEFIHPHKKCIVNQREIGSDSESFTNALRSALRQDPDVILIGEMRDLETISAAMTMAETGHLVFATLHTNSAISTINRIIDAFPPHQQPQIRTQLASTLQGVLSQELLPGANGGRVLSVELMIPNSAIRSQIREAKTHLMMQSMQVASEKEGMVTRNQSLLRLLSKRLILPKTALDASLDPDEIRAALNQTSTRRVG